MGSVRGSIIASEPRAHDCKMKLAITNGLIKKAQLSVGPDIRRQSQAFGRSGDRVVSTAIPVRDVRGPDDQGLTHLRVRPGAGLELVEDMEMKWIVHACGIIWWELTEPSSGSGDARLEWLSTMGNGRIGGFVDSGVGGTGSERDFILEVGDAGARREGIDAELMGEGRSRGKYVQRQGAVGVVVIYPMRLVCVTTSKTAHGYRRTLEKTVNVATRGCFDSAAGKRMGNECKSWDAQTPSIDLRSGLL
ncbi:hypothetical protein H4582DRAFT_2057857 [Lactarius indigo]|nr:hypothetical protein H4582DRAFT_2057857 [Lactarius indigo]